jgi:hypothetical protein
VPYYSFEPPLEIPLYLSGTFGEIRSNHFHSGIDIKTGGIEGKKVIALDDGYVSRIKISLWGYGKALYVTYPNGYVSVYGHLSAFNDTIEAFVKKEQYKRKSYVIEIFPDKEQLKVKKGEVIAYTGNSGSSAGPHLHFEIRDAANQHPLNPLLFKPIKINDIIRPRITLLAIYPENDSSVINDISDTTVFEVQGWGEQHYLKNKPDIKLHGRFSFGLASYDLQDDSRNKNGIYSEELFIDSSLVFSIVLDEFSFSTSRYINSLIDYHYYKKNKLRIIRTALDTNNKLNIYNLVKNNGIYDFKDTLYHDVTYIVKDVYGNTGKLNFKVSGYIPDTVIKIESVRYDTSVDTVFFVKFNKSFVYENNDFKISIPANSLYRSQYIGFDTIKGNDNYFSDICCIGDPMVPLQKWLTVYINLTREIPDSLTDKIFVASINDSGKEEYIGGSFENGKVRFRTRNFGKYALMIDTVEPVIKPLNVFEGKDVSSQKELKFKIKDDFSGVGRYSAFLNDKWILMEYEPKKQLLFYEIDTLMRKGENLLRVYVFDNRDNVVKYKAKLKY